MKKFSELMEKSGDTAVFTFGRLNPPTTGHGKLIDAMAREQGKNAGSKMHVFVSHSQDAKKNPLDYKRKVAYIRKMFPKYAKNILTDKAKTIFEVAVSLHNKGYKSIIMVVGSDRVDEFERLLNEYNGVQSKHGYYGFDNVEVVSAGERDPDAEGLEGMSASKMRKAAMDGDLDSFKQGVPSDFKDAEKLYKDVRKSMGIREEKNMGEMDIYEEVRDAYLTGKIWNVGDIVEANGMSGEIVRKGTNYISYMTEDNKVHKAWLHEIELDEASSPAQQAAIAISKKERGNKPKKEEVELDELKPPSRHVGKSQKNPDMFAVYDQKEKEVKLFKDKKDAEEYAIKNHEELMGHDKPKNVKEEVECDCDCGKSPCEKCGQDHHGIVEEVELGEGFSPKEIKMAIGVASDKRYAGGNMTGAVAAIDKIKKGLSDHPQVAAVLRRQNEEVELDEHKGTEPHKHPHPKDVDEASARADAMRAMRKGKSIDPADVDNVASDDDVKAASKNIMMQLRKSVNRASRGVEFGDKKKVQVDPKIAQAVISKYNSLRRPSDKEIFQAKIAKSYKDMLKALKESTIKESKFSFINKQLKGEK